MDHNMLLTQALGCSPRASIVATYPAQSSGGIYYKYDISS